MAFEPKDDWTVTYGTPDSEVHEAHILAPTPEAASWLIARALPRDKVKDAPHAYALLEVKKTNP